MEADALQPVPDRGAARQLFVVGELDGRGGTLRFPVLTQPVLGDGLGVSNEPLDQLAEAVVELVRDLRDRRGLVGPRQHLGKPVGPGPERFDLAGQVIARAIGMAVDQPLRVFGQGGEGAIANSQGRLDLTCLAQGPAVAGLGSLEVPSGQVPGRFIGGEQPVLAGSAAVIGVLDGLSRPGADLLAVGICSRRGDDTHGGTLRQSANTQSLGRQSPEGGPTVLQPGR